MATTNPPVKTLVIAGTFVTDPLAAVAYRPLAAAVGGDIMTLAGAGLEQTDVSIDKVVRRLKRYDQPPVLVGHSQGGLVAVLVAKFYPHLVAGVISLGAPLHGTCLAADWMPARGLACMAPGSPITLEAASVSPYVEPRIITIAGERDVVIQPQWSALLSGFEQYTLPVGHLRLIVDPEVLGFVRHLVRETDFEYRGNLAAVA